MTAAEAEQLLPVLVYIQAHLEEDLSLDELATQAQLSPRHLHRLFRQSLGETPKRYTQRLRLERAAFSLHFQADSILDIAVAVGYESHEVFTRAFRRHHGVSPRDYRSGLRSVDREVPAARQTAASSRASGLSAVKIIEMAPQHVAFSRVVGPYEHIDLRLWSRITSWVKERGLSGPWTLLGIGHDAPGVTPPDKLRFDAAVAVSRGFDGEGHIASQRLPGGTHAVLTHVGPLAGLPDAYAALPARLERLAGYQTTWLPMIEVYHANRLDELHTVLHTDICVPVQRVVG